MTKAIYINPKERRVEAVDVDYGDMAAIKKLIGVEELGWAALMNGDMAWNDDNALLKPWDDQAFFMFLQYPSHVAGNWLIVRYGNPGMDEECYVDCHTDLAAVKKHIKWLDPKDVHVPAPTVGSLNPDGTIKNRVTVGGDAEGFWSYTHQPDSDPWRTKPAIDLYEQVAAFIGMTQVGVGMAAQGYTKDTLIETLRVKFPKEDDLRNELDTMLKSVGKSWDDFTTFLNRDH